MTKADLKPNEYNPYYETYISQVSDETTLIDGLEKDKKMVVDFFSSLSKDKLEYRYQPEKWTIKELFQHIIDTERIFMYRLLRIARKDNTPLSGYEQDDYVVPSEANKKSMTNLLDEFITTRLYSLNLVSSISDENLKHLGTASDSPVSARACGFILLGHTVWHINIIKERYL
ncbi:DinB family protein [Polaribacter uvawellassae]|uniref:DinB family protein n=1 Tax=Polaribacter uvawellassae TaxID=3133495 RepID=UPI00321B35A0